MLIFFKTIFCEVHVIAGDRFGMDAGYGATSSNADDQSDVDDEAGLNNDFDPSIEWQPPSLEKVRDVARSIYTASIACWWQKSTSKTPL